MEKLIFDKNKILVVPIGGVRPNTWNPKAKNTEEFRKVKKGIDIKGQRLPIIVRENKGYEIIDGEQRFTACKELGYNRVIIYSEGVLSDKEAKELTIWYQQQVPFEELKLAELVSDLAKMGDIQLPYTEEEVEEYKKLFVFDFNKYNESLSEGLPTDNKKEIICPKCGHKFTQ